MEGPANPAGPATTTIEGTVDNIVFRNDETGFAVVHLATEERGKLTIVGNLYGVSQGERLRVTGKIEHDRRFGEQLKIESHVALKPQTLIGVQKYLGSGLVDGIGPNLAERLVAKFGLETLEVIESAPHRLTEVEGIGKVRADRLTKAWAAQRGVREVMIFLESAGISPAFAARVHKRFGAQAIEVVKKDPYALALEVHGIGFKLADKVAMSLGIEKSSPRRAAAGVLHVLGEASAEGHVLLPREDLAQRAATTLEIDLGLVDAAISSLLASGHLIGEDDPIDPIYLPKLHKAEREAGEILRSLRTAPAPTMLLTAEIDLAAFEAKQNITLAPEQRAAIHTALSERVSVITGGPGTGKTTLVRGILALAINSRRVQLAAPTGRAAKRLFEATGKEASTIHRLLEINPGTGAFVRGKELPLECDLLIVDEASMLDIVLFASLLAALPLRGQLVLVGDIDQLPSVGPGNVLGDLISSNRIKVARLERIFRQGEASLITTNAHRINHGELPELPAPAPPGAPPTDFYFVEREDPEAAIDVIRQMILDRIPKRFGLDPVRDVQVLTPMHRGPLGTERLNAVLQTALNPAGGGLQKGHETFRPGDKVMQIRNDYDLGVFNGDLGRIYSVDQENRSLQVDFDDRRVLYQPENLDALVLAYACSIHKSQGSEYPAVVIVVSTQHFVMLHRRLVYTAVTRGRKLVVLVGSQRALKLAVDNRREVIRHGLLDKRL